MKTKLLLLALLAQTTFAENVFIWTDSKGVMHFSDQPSLSQESIKKSVSTNPGIDNPNLIQQTAATTTSTQSSTIQYSLSITSPSSGSTIRDGAGDIEVSTDVSPALDNPTQYKLVLNMDGKSQDCDTTSMSCSLSDVARGAHTLQTQLLDQSGKILASSESTQIFVFRPISKRS